MTTRDTPWPAGTPCWVDLAVDDFGKAQAFYGGLFGWDVPTGEEEFGGYSTCTLDGRNVAGIAPKMMPEQPTVWTTYLATDDVAATLVTARESGGQVVAETMQIADMGAMGVAMDPGGAHVGFWQSGSHHGFALTNEPGSVTWTENFSTDWEANKRFYAALFGYEYGDMSGEGFQYATFKVDGDDVGGIGPLSGGMPLPEGTPPFWNLYFKVADTDAGCAEVQRLGGRVYHDPWDTPFGRMASVADDQGAPFMLMADPAQ